MHDNFITDDTEALAADANDEITAVTTELVEQAKRFDGVKMPAELARKFLLLKLSLTAPAPKDPALSKEMTEIARLARVRLWQRQILRRVRQMPRHHGD